MPSCAKAARAWRAVRHQDPEHFPGADQWYGWGQCVPACNHMSSWGDFCDRRATLCGVGQDGEDGPGHWGGRKKRRQ